MCRGAEAVDANAAYLAGSACHAQGAIANQAGAEQWRGVFVVVGGRDPEAKGAVGNRVLGIATVASIAGEQRRAAQILAMTQAVAASAACVSQPWHTHAFTGTEGGDAFAASIHPPDNLVPRYERRFGMAQITFDNVQIGATYATSGDGDAHLTVAGFWDRHVRQT